MRHFAGSQRGFTLMEVLMAVVIIGILLAIGVPSFQNMLSNARRTAAVNELVGTMHLARGEALKRGQAVTVCPTTAAINICMMGVQPATPTCSCATNTANNWSTGWLVFADLDNDGVVDQDDTALQHVLNDFTGVRIGVAFDGGETRFAFRPYNVAATRGTVTVCDARGSGTASERRGIRVDARGRTQLMAANTSGIVTHDGGSVTLTCP